MRSDPAAGGFTLLEVLVALVIASLALAVLFSGAVGGLRSTRLSGDYQEAVSRARSHLAALGTGNPLAAGVQEGDDGGGFRWRVRIVPIGSVPLAVGQEAAVDLARAPRLALFAIGVAISWTTDGGRRQVELDTERIGSAPAPPP